MKAVVAEIDKKHMIVITDKGDFVKIKRQISAAIGDEIEYSTRRTYLTYKRLAPIAACFMACIFLSTGVYAYYTPYSYVSVDINPSIAMSLNRFERVIAVEPLTEDAADFIRDTDDLKNHQIDEAISTIIKSASEKGYIDEKEENQVMVVVSAKDPKQEEKLAGKLDKTAAKELSKVNKSSNVTIEKTSVESYKAAVSNKQSPGMKILADKVREVDPEIKDEAIKAMTVQEAVSIIKEGKKAAKALEKSEKHDDMETEWKEALESKKGRNWNESKEAAQSGPVNKKENNGQEKKGSAAPSKKDEMKAAKKPGDDKTGSDKDNKGDANKKDKPSGEKKAAGKDDDDHEDMPKADDNEKGWDKNNGNKADGHKNKDEFRSRFNGQESRDMDKLFKDLMKKMKK